MGWCHEGWVRVTSQELVEDVVPLKSPITAEMWIEGQWEGILTLEVRADPRVLLVQTTGTRGRLDITQQMELEETLLLPLEEIDEALSPIRIKFS